MNANDIHKLFAPLYEPDQASFKYLIEKRPLLAHYTNISVLESILRNEEIWFSNPLFMNDLEEMRFGLNVGAQTFLKSPVVDKAAGSSQRAEMIRTAFLHYFKLFEETHAMDVYVFCVSEHDAAQTDGILSMWRAYGGNGNGAAIVFNTNFLDQDDGSPLVVGKVFYGSAEERIKRLVARIETWGELLSKAKLPDNELYGAAYYIFEWLKVAALTSKHGGFKEENEWRIVYLPDRDTDKRLTQSISYHLGSRGPEPKLKFKVKPLNPKQHWTFDGIISNVILGPTMSSPLAQASVRKMMVAVGKPSMADRVTASTIPLRPTN